MTNFGPTGQVVYERTYSRTKQDGSKEQWPETVRRVVDGNLALVDPKHHLPDERDELIRMMENFQILPAGRHLWASGVGGRQYLFNCHVSGWGANLWDHFEFTFLRLMEGGGVGANYSNRYLQQYSPVESDYRVHVVCDPEHPDYEQMKEAGVLSSEYDSEWPGTFEVEDSREGWAAALTDLLSTYYRRAKNENRVYDVSRVRQEGARLKTFGGRASGPLPLAVMLSEVATVMNRATEYPDARVTGMDAMEIDHAVAKCVVSGGNRRSARMSIMRYDDPQIREFLKCKEETGKHWTTNISVEVDAHFWDAVTAGLWPEALVIDDIAAGMLANGEPGFWDSTLSNEGEPNEVIATNPCGEIPLENWENCNLGHINLAGFVGENEDIFVNEMLHAHQLMTRFLMRATYGDVNDPKQSDTLARNRRIGVGHFGFASMLANLGVRYSDAPQDEDIRVLLTLCAKEVEREAVGYAHALRIPVPVKKRTVAPTGTIAKMPGVSEGVHPIFAKYFTRRIRFSMVDPDQRETALRYATDGYTVEDCQYAPNTAVVSIPTKDSLVADVAARYGEDEAESIVQSAAEVSLREMLEVQALYQELWADNAVSYTVNVDPDAYAVDELADTLVEYGGRLKGATVFPETSLPQAPYERMTRDEYEASLRRDVADGIDENCASGACPVR